MPPIMKAASVQKLKLKARTRFISAIHDGVGTKVVRDGFSSRIDLDYSEFSKLFDFDATTKNVLIQDALDGAFNTISVDELIAKGTSTLSSFYKTRIAVAAATIPAPLEYVYVQGYAAVGDGGGAIYVRVGAGPATAGRFQSADGAWWEIRTKIWSPEMFGIIGTNTSGDTAAWVAMASVVPAGGVVVARGEYLITGSTIIFSNLTSVSLDLTGATFRQQVGNNVLNGGGSQTIGFVDCGLVRVRNGTFYGKAAKDIAAGISPTNPTTGEFIKGDGTGSASYNGVAALFFTRCPIVDVDATRCLQHAGGAICGRECLYVSVRNTYCQGIGANYISPIDNSADCAICFVMDGEVTATSNRYSFHFTGNRVFDHAFGFQAAISKSFIFQNNTVGPIQGQHGVYGINLGGLNVVGNTFIECYQIGFKMNLKNYPGLYFAPAWASGGTYVAGDKRTDNGTLYLCISNVSGSATAPGSDLTHWAVDQDMWHKGGVISGNTGYRCGTLIGILNGLVDGLETYLNECTITGNVCYEPLQDGFIVERCKNVNFANNKTNGAGRTGFRLFDISGDIHDNISNGSADVGLLASCAYDTRFWNNQVIQSGGIPISIADVDPVTTIPSHKTTPKLWLDGNLIHFLSGDAPGVIGSIGASYDASVINTKTNSAKTFTVLGTLVRRWGNEFVSFTSGAQSTPYTVTNLSTLRTFDASTADLSTLRNVVGTLITELSNRGRIE